MKQFGQSHLAVELGTSRGTLPKSKLVGVKRCVVVQFQDFQSDRPEREKTLVFTVRVWKTEPHKKSIITRVVPDTDWAGYPANNFARYRISGRITD